MGISSKQRKNWQQFKPQVKERIIRMAWEDRSGFESIEKQFSLSPNDIERFMRTQLDTNSYKRWRKRASERGHLKHEKLRPQTVSRFKCSRQRLDGSTKGWK
ncbi:MAG: TIGR03643 family protein [Bdellovibrionaceae bacterium]|nr:TIGR03643 family protein [Pseudobdellovibrionaceae bacterium]|tara:strand:+ start:20436 stop:20741 length:306 start_codon:yes stop_codon:yes gene_type:complete